MTSYGELLQTCTEFQDNFSVLSGKYSALMQAYVNEQDHSAQLQKKLEAAAKREEQYEEQVRTLRKDLEAASGYRDKFTAATVTLEHMKDRMQHARRGVADTLAEHDSEVEQLKGQIKDLLQRVDAAADGSRVRELSNQVVELEQRAACATAALLAEKETFSQQLLVAHNALREQQARCLELEQRYRAVEGEATEMRAAVRRSAELTNDAAMLKERHASEAALAQRDVHSLRQELERLRGQLAAQQQQAEEELAQAQRTHAEERAASRSRAAALTADLAEAAAATEAEHGRYTDLLRTTQQQVDAARDEATAELTALRRALAEAREEAQRGQHRCERLREELEAAHRGAQQQQAAMAALHGRLDASARQLDEAAQQEAWLGAERTHLGEQLAEAQRRCEGLQTALQQQEHVALDLERAQMHVAVLEGEVQEARRAAREVGGRCQDVEEAAAQRLQALRQELRSCRKQLKLESETSHTLRKRLLQAVAEREAGLYHGAGESVQPPTYTGVGMAPCTRLDSPSCDVISMLKRQNEDAERLHNRVMELSH